MRRRQWTSKEELTIVPQDLAGAISVAELCNQHQTSQSQCYSRPQYTLAQRRLLQ